MMNGQKNERPRGKVRAQLSFPKTTEYYNIPDEKPSRRKENIIIGFCAVVLLFVLIWAFGVVYQAGFAAAMEQML